MPIQATCPSCQTKLQVADSARGKQIRCSRCKSVFVAGAASAKGNGSSMKPANSAVKPAAARSRTATATRPQSAPRLELADDEDSPPEKKNKKSMLPTCLIGCGLMFVLCGGGGSIGGYFAWKGINKAKDKVTAVGEQFQAEFEKAEAEQKRMREEAQKRIDEQQRLHEEARKRIEEERNKNKPGKNRPGERNPNELLNPPVNPPDKPKPPDTPAQGEVVQSVAVSIPLEGKPLDVFSILWTGTDSKQAVVAWKLDKTMRLEQYDLSSGRKLGRMETPFELFTSVRAFSPDGNYYVCNHAGTPYSIWAMPHPKAIVDKWLPPAVMGEPSGVSNTVVAAYLLDGPRVLTVNGAGQVAVWSMPSVAGGKPAQQKSYVPPPSVAKYPMGLGYGYTTLSADRRLLAVFNGSDGFFLLDTATLQLQGAVKSPEDGEQVKGAINGMLGAAFSPDGKHLAAVFHQQFLRRPKGTPPSYPQLVRWDVQTRQRTARISDPTKGPGGAGSRIGWWSNEFIWVSYLNRTGTLINWDKQSVVLHAAFRKGERLDFGSPDGKCWFVATGPDGNAVLKGIDLPAEALKLADQPLRLTADGILRK